jgi:hypothetical protein
VLSIDPCPSIEEGPGNIVTGAFSGQTVNLKRLKLTGLEKPIETTGNHPFFSEDQLAFITVNHLHPGERLRTREGVTEIESIREFPGRWDVFNLEIDGAHQYYVTDRRVLVHNGNAVIGGASDESQAVGGVYLLRDPATGQVMRTGRTNNLMRRAAEHARDPALKDYDFEPVHRTDNHAEQRGLEQMLHDQYNPPLNKINPINPANFNRQIYLDAAQLFRNRRGVQ